MNHHHHHHHHSGYHHHHYSHLGNDPKNAFSSLDFAFRDTSRAVDAAAGSSTWWTATPWTNTMPAPTPAPRPAPKPTPISAAKPAPKSTPKPKQPSPQKQTRPSCFIGLKTFIQTRIFGRRAAKRRAKKGKMRAMTPEGGDGEDDEDATELLDEKDERLWGVPFGSL